MIIGCADLDLIGFDQQQEFKHCPSCHDAMDRGYVEGRGPVLADRDIEFQVCCAGVSWLEEVPERMEDVIEAKIAARDLLGLDV